MTALRVRGGSTMMHRLAMQLVLVLVMRLVMVLRAALSDLAVLLVVVGVVVMR